MIRRLADAVGILPEYFDQSGARHETTEETRRRLLAALGHDVRDDDDARDRLAALEGARRSQLLDATRVVRAEDSSRVALQLAGQGGADVEWSIDVAREDGESFVAAGRAPVDHDGRVVVALDGALPMGYQRVRATARVGGKTIDAEQRLIVVPERCPSPAQLLRGERVFGWTANLYTVRSRRNWGAGDLTDLAALLELAARDGAAFVGVNPLHALRNAGGDISPYSPVSRLYRNELYLDVEAVPELADSIRGARLVFDALGSEALRLARDASHVDYEAVMAVKRPVLEALHATFREHGRPARRAAYEAWCAREGESLERFARFQAIDEHLRVRGASWWREWPSELRDAASPAVEAFAREHEARVDFHRWIQFELDRQLGEAARRARVAGMPLGVYQDLAIGAAPSGSDVWSMPTLFVDGVCVGAPPDPLGPEGQNWGLPPVNPHALRDDGYRYWTALIRASLRHAGALRIDHVLGLFRQFWIPDGCAGSQGAYMRFPTDDLLGVLALEATRAGALVVGEDLGTVPPEVPPTLARYGALSSKVLYFERDERGEFRSPRDYPRTALATANTHDLAPLAGWWRGRDLVLRREVGLLRDDAVADAEAERARDRASLVALLVAEGILDDGTTVDDVSELAVRAGVHALLRRSPSWLVGLSLDDLVGETEPVNVPGVGPEGFPSWQRRLAISLEQLADDRGVRVALGAERDWVP